MKFTMIAFTIGKTLWVAGMAVGAFVLVCGLIGDDEDDSSAPTGRGFS
jgi:hypothetical protein